MSMLKRNIFSNLAGGAWVAVLSVFMAPFESRDPKGSAYTLVFRKINQTPVSI